ncbi:MAG: S-methyl-5'-thioadenosine phosphorylase [Beijerinckiaceae bacterium]|nr:S-methyl-5'-thioadenosine phosphorylase [Beijerinckiaceae bacterium]
MQKAVLGIIGGSGVYHLPGMVDTREEKVESPWGEPSDTLRFGRIGETDIVFLPRHGRAHALAPSDINYHANIDILKRAGVTDLVSLSACGSFKAELYPGLFVLCDQMVDRTYMRKPSYFLNGCVAHVSMAHPIAPLLQTRLFEAANAEGIAVVKGGTHVTIEGPQFSSYAESLYYKAQGWDVIGMTAMPEARLAREAEMSYAIVAMVTDYDCWHDQHGSVTMEGVMEVMRGNTENARKLVARLAADFPKEHEPCPIGSDRALDGAIATPPDHRDPALMAKLDAIAGRVL